ncbi:hypothetical protein TNCT_435981 [Trichonephila clavata]|uniref:Uncharacterized protein n=1 Tax=Trichonephila clavata TaxID=2740835 RepID=A0A8X6HYA7_TRICU|nr:hypothetical protein TNCT_435981 [Trichonephila clavata]
MRQLIREHASRQDYFKPTDQEHKQLQGNGRKWYIIDLLPYDKRLKDQLADCDVIPICPEFSKGKCKPVLSLCDLLMRLTVELNAATYCQRYFANVLGI